MKRYGLEIYADGDVRTPVMFFESDTPFQAIQRGDLLSGESSKFQPMSRSTILRVDVVEHFFYLIGDEAKHKIMVYGTLVPNNEEARLPNA